MDDRPGLCESVLSDIRQTQARPPHRSASREFLRWPRPCRQVAVICATTAELARLSALARLEGTQPVFEWHQMRAFADAAGSIGAQGHRSVPSKLFYCALALQAIWTRNGGRGIHRAGARAQVWSGSGSLAIIRCASLRSGGAFCTAGELSVSLCAPEALETV